jgi:phenylpyruvate tautomerase PptA (4-oxalocrotonate tautomerase family)
VGSFRLPHELLVELGDTARELQLPIGMMVTAAITQLLDQPPDAIAVVVDRADDARIQGRRLARRRLNERLGE